MSGGLLTEARAMTAPLPRTLQASSLGTGPVVPFVETVGRPRIEA
jgi:hypothetical protein